MAKRPRMGRNLDALLGGASRDRSKSAASSETGSVSPPDTDATDSTGADSSVNETSLEQNAPQPINNSESVVSESKAQDAADSLDTTVDATSVIQTVDPLPVDSSDKLTLIGIDQIRRGTYQPRRLFDQKLLQELADSIKAEGLIQPILVRPFAGAFELIAGERRWRAAQLAGLTELPAIVREMPDQTVAAVALIENIQRKDLNPLEEAAAFERLCDEFGMTHKSVAESVGRSRASVSNLLRLLELHDEVKVMVDKGEIEMGHARAILGAPKDQQFEIARQVVDRELTVRAVEKLVRDLVEVVSEKKTAEKQTVIDPDIERLSQKLGETLGAGVRIQHKPNGSGKLEVSYSSVSELQGILAHIK
ncbi:MAG: ParB/RepB/Spo0J family partition protein [Granulosicoccus sp.]